MYSVKDYECAVSSRKEHVESNVLPFGYLGRLRILQINDKTDDAHGGAGKCRVRLVYANSEELEASKRYAQIDSARRKLVSISPSKAKLEQICKAYNDYCGLLNEIDHAATVTSLTDPRSEETYFSREVEPWRDFGWETTVIASFPFEKCCASFNRMCYEMSAFRRWWFNVGFDRFAFFDTFSVVERVKSNYTKRKSGSLYDIGTTGVDGEGADTFHSRQTPPDFTPEFREEIKRQYAKLRNLSCDFYLMCKNAFPSVGYWAPEFRSICDAEKCEEHARKCLYYAMMLNHVVLDKTYHREKVNLPSGFAYDKYKSALLLCHYYKMAESFCGTYWTDASGERTLNPNLMAEKSTVARTCDVYRTQLTLIMCYVRYLCDDTTGEASLQKTGILLSVYVLLRKFMGGLEAMRTKVDNNTGTLEERIDFGVTVRRLSNHVTECAFVLEQYNDRVVHNKVNKELTPRELIHGIIRECVDALTEPINIPQQFLPGLGVRPANNQPTQASSNAHASTPIVDAAAAAAAATVPELTKTSNALTPETTATLDKKERKIIKELKRDVVIATCLKKLVREDLLRDADVLNVSSKMKTAVTKDEMIYILLKESELAERRYSDSHRK